MRLRVVAANVYVGNKRLDDDLDLLVRRDPDVVGLSEAQRVRDLPGYRLFRSGIGEHSSEVPVAVRRGVVVDGWMVEQATRDGGHPRGWDNDRWWTVVRCRKEGKRFAVIATHVNAVLVGRDGRPLLRLRRVKQARRHMKLILREARWQKSQGWTPIPVGDWNYPEDGWPWYWSPERAFKRAGLAYEAHGVDGIAYDDGEWTVTRRRTITPMGANHKWVQLDLQSREG